jgi:hypothetical protein
MTVLERLLDKCRKPNVAAAMLALGFLKTDNLARVVEVLSETVHDSSNLLTLLTEPALTASDWMPLFKQTLADFGVDTPTREESAKIICQELCTMIVSGEITPRSGAGAIWELLKDIEEFTPRVTVFCELDWALDDSAAPKPFSDFSRNQIEERIKSEAASFLSSS